MTKDAGTDGACTSEADRGQLSRTDTKRVRFVIVPMTAMVALLDGDLRGASSDTGIMLPDFYLTGRARRLWRRRVAQMNADPGSARWIARAAVAEPEGIVVGWAGFHGPPDENGMVEIGYTVVPEHRRHGYARAMVRALLRRAAAEHGVRTVRASISPENTASLATIGGFGFACVGEQWDEEDGRELIFEVPADQYRADGRSL